MSERKILKDTRVFFNEEPTKEMQNLDYKARLSYQNNAFPCYLTVQVPFDTVLSVLEGPFTQEIKEKLDKGEQLGINKDDVKVDDDEMQG